MAFADARSPADLAWRETTMNKAISAVVGTGVLFALGTVAVAQDTFDLPLVPTAGDRLLIEYVHERNKNGQSNTGKAVAEIAVEEVQDDRFVASWTTRSVTVDGFVLDSSSPQAGDYLLGVPIRYVADLDGTPTRINDKDQLLDAIFGGELFGSESEETLTSVRAFMDSMTEESLAQLFLKVPAYMALCQGTSLPLGERIEGPIQIASPIGGDPVGADVSYLLEGFDGENGIAHVEYRLTLDPESAKRMTVALMEQVDAADEQTMSEIANVSIERNDSATCDVNTANGWVTSITYTTEIKVADQFKSESYVISVRENSPVTN